MEIVSDNPSQPVEKPASGLDRGDVIARLRRLLRPKTECDRLQRDALLAFLVRVVSAGILYLSQIALARWMGGHEYGIYVFVWTWILVLGGLSHLGLATAMIRLIPEYKEQAQCNLLRGLLRYGRMTALASASVVALLGLLGLKAFSGRLDSMYVLPAYLALVCIPMIAISDVQDGIGRGGGWMTVALLPPYVLRPLLILGFMGAASLLHLPMSAETAVSCAVIATWSAVAIQSLMLRRKLGTEIADGPRERRSDLWLRMSLPLLAITGSELLLQNTDVLVIAHYLQPEQAALYFAAAKTMALVLFVHYAVGSAAAKRFSALNARGDHDGLRAFVRQSVTWTFWPSLGAAILLLVLGKPLLWLFGPKFTTGYPVMLVLVLGYLGRAAMGPSEFLLNMLGQQKACAAVFVAMAVLNIVLQLVCVPALGLMGAAISTATVLALGALLNAVIAYKRLGLTIPIWHAYRRERT